MTKLMASVKEHQPFQRQVISPRLCKKQLRVRAWFEEFFKDCYGRVQKVPNPRYGHPEYFLASSWTKNKVYDEYVKFAGDGELRCLANRQLLLLLPVLSTAVFLLVEVLSRPYFLLVVVVVLSMPSLLLVVVEVLSMPYFLVVVVVVLSLPSFLLVVVEVLSMPSFLLVVVEVLSMPSFLLVVVEVHSKPYFILVVVEVLSRLLLLPLQGRLCPTRLSFSPGGSTSAT